MTGVEDDLPCRDLVEMVTDYLEGVLDSASTARVRAHLAGCPACADYVEQMRTTAGLAGRLRDDELPPQLRDGLLAAFRTRQS